MPVCLPSAHGKVAWTGVLPVKSMRRERSGNDGLSEKVAFLAEPSHYPDRPKRVELIETHFAWVFLTDQHAYKLKKPMRQGEMDYRTLERREHGCREELRLNRRLAPHVYEAVLPLSRRANGSLALGRGGRIVDWLVRMRRLSGERMLDFVLQRGDLSGAWLGRLVEVLSKFYARAQAVPFTPAAYIARLERRILVDERELSRHALRLAARKVRRVIAAQRRFLERHPELLAARAGRIVEGHGDLRPEHVWLGRPIAVIDALEFSRDLRILDPAEEIAFLALECERLAGPAIAERLMTRFCAANEPPFPEALGHFYMSRRAATRAKLAAWHMLDPQFPQHRPWRARAHSYLDDAWRHASTALRQAGSVGRRIGRRPVLEQRGDGRARYHASHGLADEQGRREDDQSVAGR